MTNVITRSQKRSQISNQITNDEILTDDQSVFLFNENIEQINQTNVAVFTSNSAIEYDSINESFVFSAFNVSVEEMRRFVKQITAHQAHENLIR